MPYVSRSLFFFLFAFLLIACESTKPIVSDLSQKEANEIVVFLDRKGIPSQKVKQVATGAGARDENRYSIRVRVDRSTEAMSVLNNAGLPRRRSKDLLTLFGQGGLVPSELEEKIKYQSGLEEQLAATIRKIDGVLDADVRLSFPEENVLNPQAEEKDKTASVYVKHQGVLDDPNSHLNTKIRRYVASSVEGLKYENVTVIGDRARFTGDPALQQIARRSEDRQWVKIWRIVIARESIQPFRMIFFGFSVTLMFFALMVLWMFWKIFPVLNATGGISQLFTLRPVAYSDLQKNSKPDEEVEDKKLEEDGEEESR